MTIDALGFRRHGCKPCQRRVDDIVQRLARGTASA
jgi:hypothetical protein